MRIKVKWCKAGRIGENANLLKCVCDKLNHRFWRCDGLGTAVPRFLCCRIKRAFTCGRPPKALISSHISQWICSHSSGLVWVFTWPYENDFGFTKIKGHQGRLAPAWSPKVPSSMLFLGVEGPRGLSHDLWPGATDLVSSHLSAGLTANTTQWKFRKKSCFKLGWLNLKDTTGKRKSVYNKKSLSSCIMENVGFTVLDAWD